MSTRKRLDRRTVLRGVGTAIAMPWMEAMAPTSLTRTVLAGQGVVERPVRLAFLFVPNGVHPPDWIPESTPETRTAEFALPPSLQPLEDVRGLVNVHTGLAHHNAKALGDGPGDHARSAACFLTGAHPRKTAGSDIVNGISVDQVAASALKGRTRFSSLELGCERGATAGNCDSGYSCAYSANISWRTPRTPMSKEISPREVFERLFMQGPRGETERARQARLSRRRSILDAVRGDARRLGQELGGRDRMKLEEYLDSVRELEQRIEVVEKAEQDPTGWGLSELPRGIPGDYQEHVDLMGDLMVLAFRLDLTRVVSFMWANEGSNRTYPMIDVREGHHHLSHHSKDEAKVDAIRRIDRWNVERFADLVKRFDAVRDQEDRSLLEDTLMVFGGAISDGNRHNHDNLPILVAGGGGGVQPGELVAHKPGTPLCGLYLSMLHEAGVAAPTFGDAKGPVQLGQRS